MKTKSKKSTKIKKQTKPIDANEINILAERDIKYVELDIDMGENVHNMLLQYAKENIMNDEKALINWAFINAIENGIKQIEKNEKRTKQ